MRSVFRTLLSCLAILCLALPARADTPRPYTIAYMEAGPFWLYQHTYNAFKEAMAEEDGVRVVYPESMHISPDWKSSSEEMTQKARELFAAKPDLIVAAGTGAVRALLKANDGTTPILGIAVADPVAAGVMKSATESVAPNFTCEVIPDRWENMYRVFHNVVGFSKLGIMYPEGTSGRIYGGVEDALAVGKEAGFTVVEAVIPDEGAASCAKGIEQLRAKGADAFFIGPLNCFDWSATDPTPLLKTLNENGIPTFARDGSHFVQGGALMGFSIWNFASTGEKLAEAAVAMLRGTPASQIHMAGVSEPLIALNLETARTLGLDLPFDVLVVADEIYEKTTIPTLK